MGREKIHLSLVAVGHVDAGKSTTLGHLLLKCGGVDRRAMEKYEKESVEYGRCSFKYAWILDKLITERERGITIDISLQKFESQHYCFTLIDAPGHRDFIKNMITGAAMADAAMLVVDSSNGGFEAGMSREFGQTREHLLLCYTLGVKQLVVVCNKMDHQSVQFSRARFETIKTTLSRFLNKIGYKALKAPFIPLSGWTGDNMICKSEMLLWYDGPTLLEALDNLHAPKRPSSKPLRLPISDVYKISGVGTVPVGRVETGIIKPDTDVVFAPVGLNARVRSIEKHHTFLDEAYPGDCVGMNVLGVDAHDLKRGYVASDPANDPALACSSFVAQVHLLNHPGNISNGYCPILDCHTAHVACRFVRIKEKLVRHNEQQQRDPRYVKEGDAIIVEMQPTKPLCVESFAAYPPLGRFSLRDMNRTVGIGVIRAVEKQPFTNDGTVSEKFAFGKSASKKG